jgi:ACS family hexuronate transporter-like MFS transporter
LTITGIGGLAAGTSSFLGFEGKEAGYMTVFCMCAVAYLFAWVVMKILVPAYKRID